MICVRSIANPTDFRFGRKAVLGPRISSISGSVILTSPRKRCTAAGPFRAAWFTSTFLAVLECARMKEAPKRRFPGSAIIAAHAAKPFRKIIVCEQNRRSAKACRARLEATPAADRCEVLVGDCNALVHEVVQKIPQQALTLAFVDPKGLGAQFKTIEFLANHSRVDFVVLFADALDIRRNAEHVYRSDPNSNLDQFLGPDSNWRMELDKLENPNDITRRKLFADIYKRQLQRLLGYRYFGEKVMKCDGKPLYRLIYASNDELGLKFWKEALKEDSCGQRGLFD